MKLWSGTAMLLALSLAEGLAMGAAAEAQQGAHNPDWRKCRACVPAAGKAMAYVKANLGSDAPKRVIGSRMGGYMMGGFALMIEGVAAKELDDCVRYACRAIQDEGFNRNWYLSMSMLFLAEHATRYGFTPATERALADGLKRAAAQQEETGGWCHHLGMWKGGYNTMGGGKDLGMITSLMYGAFLQLEALGVEVGPMMEKARKNLESLNDGGGGVRYGTDNGVGDPAFGRASWVLSSFLAGGPTTDPWAGKLAKALPARIKKIEEGAHGFAPLHYFSVALAAHRLGPDAYGRFTAEYLDRLILSQRPDGVVPLHQEDDVASTATFAAIVMMQKPGAFVAPPRKRKKA